MEKYPFVSIIIPVYNSQKEIDRCLESVIRQTYRDFEVILINDGSTDNSLEICELYLLKDERIRLFTQENSGAASARNVGIEKAKGEYIKFVDSDDELPDDCLEKHFCNGLADVVVSGFTMKWDNKTYNVVPDKNELYNKVDIISCVSGWRDILLFGSVCNKLYKKSIIVENDILFSTHTHDVGEDHIFNWKYITKCNSFISLPEVCYYYIEKSDSLSHFSDDVKPNVDNHLRLMKQLLLLKPKIEKITDNVPFSIYHDYFMDVIIRRLYLSVGVPLNERIEYLKIFRNTLSEFGYNPVSVSNGLLNKGLSVAILIPSLNLSDAFIRILFKIRGWL